MTLEYNQCEREEPSDSQMEHKTRCGINRTVLQPPELLGGVFWAPSPLCPRPEPNILQGLRAQPRFMSLYVCVHGDWILPQEMETDQ